MPPNRRRPAAVAAATADHDPTTTEPDDATLGMSQPAKRFKPTVAANAEAIAALGQQMSGVDSRLESITLMLANLSAGGPNQQVTSVRDSQNIQSAAAETAQNVQGTQYVTAQLPGVPQQVSLPQTMAGHTPATAAVSQPRTPVTYFTPTPVPGATAGHRPGYSMFPPPLDSRTTAGGAVTMVPATTLQALAGTTAPNAAASTAGHHQHYQPGMGDASQRHRHFTTCHVPQPPMPPSAWAGATGAPANTSRQPPTLPPFPTAYRWDQPTSLHDLEGDPAMTRRVTEALHTMTTPFTACSGKHAHFPHQLVNRGSKMQKTALGELTLPEFIWGFIQLIKAKEAHDPDVQFMYAHLENLVEDAKTYDWSSVRAWSEEVLARVFNSKLAWSNSYEIDRLQTKLSHQYKPDSAPADATHRGDTAYRMPDSVRKAKPGPPCKPFQAGTCTQAADHINNGYRQLHVCTYCLANKCELHPQKFNDAKRDKKESGFGPKTMDK